MPRLSAQTVAALPPLEQVLYDVIHRAVRDAIRDATAQPTASPPVARESGLRRRTVAEAAEQSRRSRETVLTALQIGELHGHQRVKGGKWLIKPECIEAWMSGNGEDCCGQGESTPAARVSAGARRSLR
ncbi:helix-turn-helix domain-containing protein [Kineococcus sp. R86509]|uniref:helix-turn-helix domain-containing protein n=1 Tax=Kineococcus sp. R86509 TaxID=3093851 RepID=UPI0036D419BB